MKVTEAEWTEQREERQGHVWEQDLPLLGGCIKISILDAGGICQLVAAVLSLVTAVLALWRSQMGKKETVADPYCLSTSDDVDESMIDSPTYPAP